MISALLSPLALKLGGILAGVFGLLGLLFKVRQGGVQAQQLTDIKMNLKRVEVANAALNDVARLSDASVDQRLRGQFSRD